MAKKSYLIEFVRVGRQVKVTACDPESGTETVVIAPANTTQKDLMDLAVKKLEYVLARNLAGDGKDDTFG